MVKHMEFWYLNKKLIRYLLCNILKDKFSGMPSSLIFPKNIEYSIELAYVFSFPIEPQNVLLYLVWIIDRIGFFLK